MFNLVIFGPPGSGKGTQSEKIIEKYQLKHLSTGDLLRAEKQSGSPLGKKIDALISGGNLVPDTMVQEMVEAFVIKNKHENGIIFDGFPRTVAQAEWLQNMLSSINEKINALVFLDVNDEELVKRILERGKASGRSDDQDASIIQNRIEVYNSQTLPVIDFYRQQGVSEKIDGIGSIDSIFSKISQAIDSKL